MSDAKYVDDCSDGIDTVLAKLGTSPEGLDEDAVKVAREKYGKNELPEEEGDSFWDKFIEQFDDPLVKILLAAAAISFGMALIEEDTDHLLTAYAEPVVILVILIANAYVGAAQEMQAESAIEALQEYSAAQAKVIRKGKAVESIDAAELVPGDVVEVAAGDNVPADIRVIQLQSTQLKLDQAIVTGESVTVAKFPDPIAKKADKPVLQDRKNTMFMGTNVAVGKVLGVVVGTGSNTEIGKIQDALNDEAKKKKQLELLKQIQAEKDASAITSLVEELIASDNDKNSKYLPLKRMVGEAGFDKEIAGRLEQVEEALDDKTPLGKKIADFGDTLCNAIMVICILVWAIEIYNLPDRSMDNIKGYLNGFKIAVALAVAAIPEGLPAVITTCLALGTQRMAAKNALVRKLPSVETLGCTSVICSDKTGTLTTNMMCVQDFFVIAKDATIAAFQVEGTSFDPIGAVAPSPKDAPGEVPMMIAGEVVGAISELGNVYAIANDCKLIYDEKAAPAKYSRIGEPTEAALLVLTEKLNMPGVAKKGDNTNEYCNAVRSSILAKFEKDFSLEFDRDRKRMSAVATGPGGSKLYCKGAPERVLEQCTHVLVGSQKKPLTPALRKTIEDKILEYSVGEKTLRCIGAAVADVSNVETARKTSTEEGGASKLESGMTFVGVAGMIDPARPEVAPCIKNCKDAGIRVVMITGDNKNTAVAIAKKIGIMDEQHTLEENAFLGAEFAAMSHEDKIAACDRACVFARVEPTHKQAIVEILQEQGHIAAMTGDGVNDAPALKKADIGIAMGSGTAVAKTASAMILSDDNFATIVHAVEEGRAIYNNTKQFIRYLISSNIGEVVSIFLNSAIGMPPGLVSVQLLWVNLVTDGLPATALGFNPPDLDIMEKPPRKTDDSLINGWLFFRYMAIGLYVGWATVAGAYWWFVHSEEGPMVSYWQLTNYKSCNAGNAEEFKGSNQAFYDGEVGHTSYVDSDACAVFKDWTPMTMALTVLVMIELLNALNSVSEDQSMLAMPPWKNMWLIGADLLSLSLHFMILYVPFFTEIFQLVPLNGLEWKWVMYLAGPVILLDEVLKLVARLIGVGKAPAKDKSV